MSPWAKLYSFLWHVIYSCLSRIWNRAWLSLDFFRFEFSCLFGVRVLFFQVSKFYNFSNSSFSGLRQLAQNSSSFQVYGFEIFWPKFGQNSSFFGKIFNSSEMDLICFNFRVFFEFGFWQSLAVGFFRVRVWKNS